MASVIEKNWEEDEKDKNASKKSVWRSEQGQRQVTKV